MAGDRVRETTPRWLAPVTLLLALVGVAVATYLTVAHYDRGVVLACSDSGTIDCAKVTSSQESTFLGVPVAVWGLSYFVLALPFFLPVAWRSRSPLVRLGRLGGAVGGMGFVLWLLYAELVIIRHICLYCSAVHVLTLLIFLVVLYGTIATSVPSLDDADDPADSADELDGADDSPSGEPVRNRPARGPASV